MHPILLSGRRLLLYVLAWMMVLSFLAFVSAASGGRSWQAEAAVLGPACLVFAFVCLTPWYICQVRPLGRTRAASLAVAHTAAGGAGSAVFVGSAGVAASLLNQTAPATALLFGMGMLLYLVSVGLHYAALAAMASRDAERRAAEARTLAREAELQALRFQLNPHFLFNSLHSISALATQDGARARDMCLRLAEFLRSSLGLGNRESIALSEELALARSYLEVERVRYGQRLRVEEDIDESCQDCRVPALLLQPLVENAVRHGIAGLLEGGSIRLTVRRSTDEVSVMLANAYDPEAAGGGSGLGLAHVRQRLKVSFGPAATLQAGPEGDTYRVVLRFPFESPMSSISRA